jgi:hypothetical protein
MRPPGLALVSLVAISLPAVAFACPDCATSQIVRASLFDERFWTYLLFISLPLVVLVLLVAALHRITLHDAKDPGLPEGRR